MTRLKLINMSVFFCLAVGLMFIFAGVLTNFPSLMLLGATVTLMSGIVCLIQNELADLRHHLK